MGPDRQIPYPSWFNYKTKESFDYFASSPQTRVHLNVSLSREARALEFIDNH